MRGVRGVLGVFAGDRGASESDFGVAGVSSKLKATADFGVPVAFGVASAAGVATFGLKLWS